MSNPDVTQFVNYNMLKVLAPAVAIALGVTACSTDVNGSEVAPVESVRSSAATAPIPLTSAHAFNGKCDFIQAQLPPGKDQILRGIDKNSGEVAWYIDHSPYNQNDFEVRFTRPFIDTTNQFHKIFTYIIPGQSLHQDYEDGESLDLVADFMDVKQPAGPINIVGQLCPPTPSI